MIYQTVLTCKIRTCYNYSGNKLKIFSLKPKGGIIMAKLKKWHIALIVISSIVVILGVTALTIYFVVYANQQTDKNKYEDLEGFERLEWIIGTNTYKSAKDTTKVKSIKIDLLLGEKAANGATYSSSNSEIASVEGNVLTVNKIGGFTLQMNANGKNSKFPARVVNGVNVFTFEDLYNAVILKDIPIQQAAIKTYKATSQPNNFAKPAKTDQLDIYTSFYGNAYMIDASKSNTEFFAVLFNVKANQVFFYDAYLRGAVPPTEEVELGYYQVGGTLVSFDSTTDNRVSGGLLHCVLENGHKVFLVNAADVEVKGSIIRNASDACISIQTNNEGTSNITLENNVLMDAAVAGIVMWCMQNDMIPANYVNLTIKGFLDIYNWKDIEKAKLIPDAEGALADLFNPQIVNEMKKDKYNDYFYITEVDGVKVKYIHSGIIVIATGNSKNLPNIKGYEEINFEKRNFPIPSFAEIILKSCDVYGYNKNPNIIPGKKINDNPKIFDELIKGRK